MRSECDDALKAWEFHRASAFNNKHAKRQWFYSIRVKCLCSPIFSMWKFSGLKEGWAPTKNVCGLADGSVPTTPVRGLTEGNPQKEHFPSVEKVSFEEWAERRRPFHTFTRMVSAFCSSPEDGSVLLPPEEAACVLQVGYALHDSLSYRL